MIPAQNHVTFNAVFHGPYGPNGENTTWRQPVVAWGNDGAALVLHRDKLVPATEVDGYGMIEECRPTLWTVPGGGWRVEVEDEDGTVWSTPVIAWQVRDWAMAKPLVVSRGGHVGYPENMGVAQRIYHPDTTVTPAAQPRESR